MFGWSAVLFVCMLVQCDSVRRDAEEQREQLQGELDKVKMSNDINLDEAE